MTNPEKPQRIPHPAYAAYWAVWLVNIIVAAAIMPPHVWYAVGVLIAFGPVEYLGVTRKSGGMRDTLSEIMSYYFGHLSKHRLFAQGWNALLLIIAMLISYVWFRVAWYFTDFWPIAAATAILMTIWLDGHWRRPTFHG